MEYVNCHSVAVARIHPEEFWSWFDEAVNCAKQTGRGKKLFIVNAHTLNLAHEVAGFRDALRSADLVLNDGVGLEMYSKWLRQPFYYNFNGTDLFPALFEYYCRNNKTLTVFLYGAKPGIAEKAKLSIEQRYPNVSVAGLCHGYVNDKQLVTSAINSCRPDLLLVAMGNPRQEVWIAENMSELRVGVACGVGALFDFLSGVVPRAPLWMRSLKIEWVYRLFREPTRLFRRYIIGNPLFLLRSIFYLTKNRQG